MTDEAALQERLKEFSNLKKGWNGYKAEPPSESARTNLQEFWSLIPFRLYYVRCRASYMGGIGVTIKKTSTSDKMAYIEFYNNGEVHSLFSDDLTEEMTTQPVETTQEGYKEILILAKEYLQ